MPNQNGKLNAARLAEMNSRAGQMSQSQKPAAQPKTYTPEAPKTMPTPPKRIQQQAAMLPAMPKKALSAAGGAAVGVAGSIGGLMGADPRRASVPANQYGKENKAFGKAYNIASAPGSFVAKVEKRIGKAL